MEDRSSGSNELILNPGEYAFLQDKTTGNVQTHVGPLVVTQSGQLRSIQAVNGTFQETSLQGAVEQCMSAEKGEYLILHNPTVDENGLKHPAAKSPNASVPELRHGEKIVIQGPIQFALWPEQCAEVVDGHNLRNDQFLVVRVYDEDAAVANWSDAVVQGTIEEDEETIVTSRTADELGLTLGQLLVIKGVSFYIPATGIEVVQDDDKNFIRDALTLEMAEYAILVDQSGNKRYERGPQIVFPEPTEEFYKDQDNIKFRPIELTPTQGLHLKINSEYLDENWPEGARRFTEGEEIFITGETHPIYYPVEEQAIIRYGDNLIHYATAVPSGQARYVMDKTTGVIATIEGPDMILLNPVTSVFVQRVLSDNESLLMYPGNADALEYNKSLRQFQVSSGVKGEALTSNMLSATCESDADQGREVQTMSAMRGGGPRREKAGRAALPDQMERKTSYTKPHSVTFDDNRFSGVPTLKIWTGFAVLLVKANGRRRVEVGPKTVLLDYDETVQSLHLSQGKPKTTDTLLTTGYLEVSNNKVSDIIRVETKDGVDIDIKVSYRVSFTGEPESWFNIDNYVKFLCDHARSRLKGVARHHTVRDFYNNTVDIVRDTLLGVKVEDEPRTGLLFDENGMHLTEVDLLGVTIADRAIEALLVEQQQAVVTDQIAIDRAQQKLEVDRANQGVEKSRLELADDLRAARHGLDLLKFADTVKLADLRAADALQRAEEDTTLTEEVQKSTEIDFRADQTRVEIRQALAIAESEATTSQMVARFKSCEGDMAAAINQLGDQKVIETVAQALGPMGLIGDVNLGTVIGGLIGSAGQKSQLFDRLTTLVDTHAGNVS